MDYNTFERCITAIGGTCRRNIFDGGYTVSINLRHDGNLIILRFSHEWGDATVPEDRIRDDLAARGIFLGEDDPSIQHEAVTL